MKKYAREFKISTAPQRSEQWFKEHAGIPSASGLTYLFDTLKDGFTPSAKGRKYRQQLAYERRFGITFGIYQTKAMADGTFFEDFAKMVYERDTGNKLSEAYSYISPWFIATPDAVVTETTREMTDTFGSKIIRMGGKVGGLECKVVGDATFMEAMEEGAPIMHELQVQGQMLATGWDWVDYVIVNLKTRAYFIQRVPRNNKLIKRIYERLHEPLDLPVLKDVGVKQFDDGMLENWMGNNNVKEQDLEILDLPF